MSICKYCLLEIFWKDVNGKMLPFEDLGNTILHNCPKLKQNKTNHDDDHLLLTKTITRLSALEREVDQLKKKCGENKNEV